MDFMVCFFIGYFLRDIYSYIKSLVNDIQFNDEFDSLIEWDSEWNHDDLP